MQAMKRATLPYLLLLLVAAACGFPRPADVGDDGGPGDTPDPGVSIHVSPSGHDTNDGIAAPVKTLKHAIGLAIGDARITQIALASGTYSAATGETFPYTVPLNVTIAGPAGGGAVLVGNKMLPGMTVEMGVLQDLDLQDFTTAITVTRTADLKNVRVVTNKIAVQAETDARLTVNGLDITGVAGVCPTGIVLLGTATLTASNLTTRALGTSLAARDHSTVALKSANATGDPSCFVSMFDFTSKGVVDMSDSMLEGGTSGIGIDSSDSSAPTQATLTRITVRNTNVAMGGRNATVHAVDCRFSRSRSEGISIAGGVWSLTDVTIDEGSGLAIYSQDTRLAMRGCMVLDNREGVDLGLGAIGDLGTTTSLGNNVFKNMAAGLVTEGNNGPSPLQAVGNTWKVSQGADQNGRYGIGTVMAGSTPCASSDNFCIQSGTSIQL
ncbi:MAG TPA: DUF1565 domain-containing protein [Kofleriaceae bacterium]|jgi:hypothetical protein